MRNKRNKCIDLPVSREKRGMKRTQEVRDEKRESIHSHVSNNEDFFEKIVQ